MVVVLKRRRSLTPLKKPKPPRNAGRQEKEVQDRLDRSAAYIEERYLKDLISINQLSAELGTSHLSLAKWMDARGWQRRDAAQSGLVRRQVFQASIEAKVPEILRLRREHAMPLTRIATTVGLGVKTVTAIVREAGLIEIVAQSVAEDSAPDLPEIKGSAKLDLFRDKVISAIKEGNSVKVLSSRFRVSQDSVYKWLRDNDLKLIPLTPLQRCIVHLWQTTDLNKYAISKRLGCSRTNVTQALRRAGLEDSSGTYGRPRGSANGRRAPVREDVAETAPEPVLEDALA